MVFHWSLSDSKSPRHFSILTILNNVVVWMVSTHPLISKSFGDCTKSTNYNWDKRHFHVSQIFQFPSKLKIFFLFVFFQFYSMVSHDNKVHNFVCSPFLLIIIRSGCLAEIRWPVCMSMSHRSLNISFSWTAAGLCIYNLFIWSNFNFLYIFPVDHLAHPIVSGGVLMV